MRHPPLCQMERVPPPPHYHVSACRATYRPGQGWSWGRWDSEAGLPHTDSTFTVQVLSPGVHRLMCFVTELSTFLSSAVIGINRPGSGYNSYLQPTVKTRTSLTEGLIVFRGKWWKMMGDSSCGWQLDSWLILIYCVAVSYCFFSQILSLSFPWCTVKY